MLDLVRNCFLNAELYVLNFTIDSSVCVRGKFHCNSDKCNPSNIICPNNLEFTETNLGACPKTCSNHLIWKNCHKYRPGCGCPKDMILDEHVN